MAPAIGNAAKTRCASRMPATFNGLCSGASSLHAWIPRSTSGTARVAAFGRSAVDALVDIKLLDYANKKFGAKKAGLMLINNPWGQSNEQGLIAAAKTGRGKPRG